MNSVELAFGRQEQVFRLAPRILRVRSLVQIIDRALCGWIA